jgi:hypothetical protein
MVRKMVSAVTALVVAASAPEVFADNPDADVRPSADAAWLVIGIQPATARMEIDEALIRNGKIRRFNYNFSAYHPVDGFIVVKVKPGTVYGIGASSLMFGKSIFGVRYKPCGHAVTFQADAGKVVYVTTISYHAEGTRYAGPGIDFLEGADYSTDIDGARAFLRAHYPGLSESLEQGAYETSPMERACL